MGNISKETRDKLNSTFCRKHRIVPYDERDEEIYIFVLHEDTMLQYNLQERLKKNILMNVCPIDVLEEKLEEYCSGADKTFSFEVFSQYEDEETSSIEELTVFDSPVVQFLDYILNTGIERGASDIHFEIFRKEGLVRYRIDGFLQEFTTVPIHIYPYLVSRIKILAQMDITEKRIPQDGRFSYSYQGRNIDIRVASSPTGFGEKVVFRILDTNRVTYTADGIGLEGRQLQLIHNLISQPNGMILFCGPTSSGKSSSLYTMLKKLNGTDKNILTIEDPIEYKLKGVNQIEVNELTGLTFATGLKAILRMDPDIIMIGEIRNSETAHIAITSSITGHLVLSTLHTENSPAAVHRLIDMGIEPYLVAAGLIGVVSQRLIRTLCPHCKRKVMQFLPMLNQKREIFEPVGCEYCHNGYLERKAVFEIMLVDEPLREMIVNGVSTSQIKKYAVEQGMSTLGEEILKLILAGKTSLEEYYHNILTVGEL